MLYAGLLLASDCTSLLAMLTAGCLLQATPLAYAAGGAQLCVIRMC